MAFSSSRPGGMRVSKSRLLRGKLPQNPDDHRVNERIRVPEVRLVDSDGTQLGIVKTAEALDRARSKGLDLMEVSPNSRPPVCKICDYGKFKYEKKKKEHAARKKQQQIKVKEVQVRPNTEKHDLEFKIKNARQFLEEGDKVKISMLFRGREITHTDVGRKVMLEVKEALTDLGEPEQEPQMEGRKMLMILAPFKKKAGKGTKKEKTTKKPSPKKDTAQEEEAS